MYAKILACLLLTTLVFSSVLGENLPCDEANNRITLYCYLHPYHHVVASGYVPSGSHRAKACAAIEVRGVKRLMRDILSVVFPYFHRFRPLTPFPSLTRAITPRSAFSALA